MTTLSTVIAEGVFSGRPSAGINGRLYFATDTGHIYRDNGSGWDDVTPGGALGTFLEELVTFSGTSGTLAHTPVTLIGIFRNGLRMRSVGGSPNFTISGAAVTLAVAAGGSDEFVAVYFY